MKQSRRGLFHDLNALEVFLAVSETGSMTKAADRLSISQPAVTQVIQQMEAELGEEILDRSVRPFTPTPLGELLVERARKLLVDAESYYNDLRTATLASVPHLRIGLIDSFAVTVGPSLVRVLRNKVEHLTVWSGDTPQMREAFLSRRLDMAIFVDPIEDAEGVERRALFQEPFILLVPNHLAPLARQRGIHGLAEVSPLVRYSARSVIGQQIDQHLRRIRLDIPHRLEFDATDSVYSMVNAGVGWAITTPLCLAQGGVAHLDVEAMPISGAGFSRTLHMVYRKGELGDITPHFIDLTRSYIYDTLYGVLEEVSPECAQPIIVF